MKKLFLVFFSFLLLFTLVVCKNGNGGEVKEKRKITFNVQMPKLEGDDYTFVVYGSFSNWEVNPKYILAEQDDHYTITVNVEKDSVVEYKYAIYEAGEDSMEEAMLDGSDMEKRKVTADEDKTVNDTVERFKGVNLASEVPEVRQLLDNTFYDNDHGNVHTINYQEGAMIVTYSKKENNNWSCIIRQLDEDMRGKLHTITFKFVGEKGVEYLFKVEGGDGAQEETVLGTGVYQEYTMTIVDTARNSTRLVIFGHRGLAGTLDNPVTGSYTILSIEATIKEPEPEKPYVPGENPIHILAIGNSFSDDGLWLIYNILADLGYDDIIVANLYIGGCSVEAHKNNLQKDSPAYTYRVNKNGTWISKDGFKASTALEAEKWDFISLQQASNYSGLVNYYVDADISYIYSYAKEIAEVKNPDVKFVWQMTWAYQQNSTHSAFPNYGSNQMTMYNGILTATQQVIANNQFHPIIVPSGTAIQNLRTTFIGDNVTRDGYHLNEAFGRYTAALTWAIKLTGKDISEVSAPPSVASKLVPLCKESAKNACLKPFEITESEYKVDEEIAAINLDDLILLDSQYYILGNGYYNSQDSSKFLQRINDGSDFCNGFITTKLFTKNDLPIGSVIVVDSGYQYRPEGWIDEAKQTSRNGNTTEEKVLVTEEWWANYIYRAFNISKVGGGVLTGDAYTEALSHFKIYIPKQ